MLASLVKTAVLSVSATANAFTMQPKKAHESYNYDIDLEVEVTRTTTEEQINVENTTYFQSTTIGQTQTGETGISINYRSLAQAISTDRVYTTPRSINEPFYHAINIDLYTITTNFNLTQCYFTYDYDFYITNPNAVWYNVKTWAISTYNPDYVNRIANNNTIKGADYLYEYYRQVQEGQLGYDYNIISDESKTDTRADYPNTGDSKNVPVLNRVTNYIIIFNIVYTREEAGQQNLLLQSNKVVTSDNRSLTGSYVINTDSYEVIDLPGLMFTVLTMPFTFVSQGMNLTLFPGTPYQINIGNLLLAIFGIAVIVFVLLKVFKK